MAVIATESVKKLNVTVFMMMGSDSEGNIKYSTCSMGSNFNPETFDINKVKNIIWALIDVLDGTYGYSKKVTTSHIMLDED